MEADLVAGDRVELEGSDPPRKGTIDDAYDYHETFETITLYRVRWDDAPTVADPGWLGKRLRRIT